MRGATPAGTVSWDAFLAAGEAVDEHEIARREAAVTGSTVRFHVELITDAAAPYHASSAVMMPR